MGDIAEELIRKVHHRMIEELLEIEIQEGASRPGPRDIVCLPYIPSAFRLRSPSRTERVGCRGCRGTACRTMQHYRTGLPLEIRIHLTSHSNPGLK